MLLAKPHVCPVCCGKGEVPSSFYDKDVMATTNNNPVTCRTCSGRGIVWDYTHCEGETPCRTWNYEFILDGSGFREEND